MDKDKNTEPLVDLSIINGGIKCAKGKIYQLSHPKKQGGLKKDIIELVLNLAAPDDDCMLSDFLHALQYVLDKHHVSDSYAKPLWLMLDEFVNGCYTGLPKDKLDLLRQRAEKLLKQSKEQSTERVEGVLYPFAEAKLMATRFAKYSRDAGDVTSNDTITSFDNWFKPECFKPVNATQPSTSTTIEEKIKKLIEMQERSAVRYKACFGEQNPGGEQIYEYFALQLKELLTPPNNI